ncbi:MULTISPECIES: hypothetical protein [unclassified Streptomyces]|uniref:hypothetical protein n=1 Tax=unclassified Streptomyces TaxID=2593676 RepID=UPI00224DC0FC|nr:MULTISPECIES: hypothetical protein [unclassified Streptomyces]MCX4528070.1 hypothetical protein [Streptomyces sp. NBC_01551]MCX4541315.1 hypothetical protein [Streptomyces sp. NBC_01565]
MSTDSRRTLVRAAAVTACAGSLLALPTAAALAEGLPAVSASAAAPAAAAAPQRTLVKSLSLADGVSTAHVYRVARNAYQADILRDGATVATLTSRDGVPARGEAGALHAALQPDGRLSSWVGEARPAGGSHRIGGDGHKTGTRDGQVVAASAPGTRAAGATDGRGGTSGTVAAAGRTGAAEALKLDSLADGPGDGLLLLAAGGGIAAVGAAGLGFAMLRRGRTNA